MNINMRRGAVALAASIAALGASAAPVDLGLDGWRHGSKNVKVTGFQGRAGGFTGSLAQAGEFDQSPFNTYSIEIEGRVSFRASATRGYRVVDGERYFERRGLGADTAERLGRLWTYVSDTPEAVDSAVESAAMQLAIWNIIYDSDETLDASRGAAFSDRTRNRAFRAHANELLGASSDVENRFDIHALRKRGRPDLLLTSERDDPEAPLQPSGPNGEPVTRNDVPEPASFVLSLVALVALGAVGRRRWMTGSFRPRDATPRGRPAA